MASVSARGTRFWLDLLVRREKKMHEEYLDLSEPVAFSSEDERRAAIKFFNAALRAEESGLFQAHTLSREVEALDPELSEVLRLYGNEEGWHKELITQYLEYLGGSVEPMGRVTRTLYRLYGRARRMETIVLVNLMFETIGSATYRMALRNVHHRSARQMLTILTRDESFHVPLNVHFLKEVLKTRPEALGRLRVIYHLLLVSLLLLPLASRPKAKAFDGISSYDLSRKYAEMLCSLFLNEPDLGLKPPSFVLRWFGLKDRELTLNDEYTVSSSEAAERAAERRNVEVTAL